MKFLGVFTHARVQWITSHMVTVLDRLMPLAVKAMHIANKHNVLPDSLNVLRHKLLML